MPLLPIEAQCPFGEGGDGLNLLTLCIKKGGEPSSTKQYEVKEPLPL